MSDRDDLRATLWRRWPDEKHGPLWVAIHINRRAGVARLVGSEVWSEPPGNARTDLGPEADPADDLLPWPAPALRSKDVLSVSLPALLALLLPSLPAEGHQPALSGSESAAKPGRPPTYGPEHWRAVATVWSRASNGRKRAAVAEEFYVSANTAKHWIRRCRSMGLL